MNGAKYAVLLAALILGPATACASDENANPLKNLQVQEKLQRCMDFNFQGMTLNELLQFFRETLQINVVLDSSAAPLGDRPITLQLKDVRAQDALTWSLRQVGLRYALIDGVVFVADRQHADATEPTILRQYDVSDLMMIPELATVTNGNANAAGANGALAILNINKSSTDEAVAAADLTDSIAGSAVRRNAVQIASLGQSGNLSIRKESKESIF